MKFLCSSLLSHRAAKVARPRHVLPTLSLLLSVSVLVSCLPPSDPYPFRPPTEIVAEATDISDQLENYIDAWLAGNVPAQIPAHLIPTGISDSKDFYLKRPDEVQPGEAWATRFRQPIDRQNLLAGVPDPNITYLFLGTAFAPFGHKLVIEGEFPHARFFSVQVTPPLDGKSYYAGREFGGAEVSIVDADIEPLPGHTNPYRAGADRNAEDRSYRLEIDLATGDPNTLNPDFAFPYRNEDNTLAGAMLVYQGPLGFKTIAGTPLANPGPWNLGALWLRIYLPDEGTDALGGVAMPEVYFETPSGQRYFIGSDYSALQQRADTGAPNVDKSYPDNPNFGPHVGWYKSWGITRSILTGICQTNGWSRDSAARVREIDYGWTGRRADAPGYRSIEPHATTNNYINYLGRTINIPRGEVVVLTGKMPEFADTREGTAYMPGGEVRYWSITGIDVDALSPLPATAIHNVVDDEVVLDDDRNYIIVYSHAADRPSNATAANGVTWVDAGTQTSHGLLVRWLAVSEDWTSPYAPSEDVLTMHNSDWASAGYDDALLGRNWRLGHMACYQPRVHQLTRSGFESLAGPLRVADVPVWVNDEFRVGAAASQLARVDVSSTLDASPGAQASNLNDGDLTTAWSSGFNADTATVTFDFDSLRSISAVKLMWDPIFFARDYEIQIATTGSDWRTVAAEQGATAGGVRVYSFTPTEEARYVRVRSTRRNVSFVTLKEAEVYVSDCDCAQDSSSSVASPPVPSAFQLRPQPNPAVDFFQLPLASHERWQLFTLSGKLVSRGRGARVEVAALPAGVYVVRARGASAQVVVR